jgi:hypothetical protein
MCINLQVNAIFENTGQLPILRILDGKIRESQTERKVLVDENKNNEDKNIKYSIPLISGGPLGAYKYRLHEIVFHFGNASSRVGSDHAVDGQFFAGEVS